MREVAPSVMPQAAARRVRYEQCDRRVIGWIKIRYKTLRACKSIEGMMNGLWLTQRVWGESRMDMGELWPRSGWAMRA